MVASTHRNVFCLSPKTSKHIGLTCSITFMLFWVKIFYELNSIKLFHHFVSLYPLKITIISIHGKDSGKVKSSTALRLASYYNIITHGIYLVISVHWNVFFLPLMFSINIRLTCSITFYVCAVERFSMNFISSKCFILCRTLSI